MLMSIFISIYLKSFLNNFFLIKEHLLVNLLTCSLKSIHKSLMHALRNCHQGKRTNKTFCLWHLEIVSISFSSHSRFCVCECAVFVLVGMSLIRVDSCDLLYVQYDGGCHCFMSFLSLILLGAFSVSRSDMLYYSQSLYHPQLLLSALHFSFSTASRFFRWNAFWYVVIE